MTRHLPLSLTPLLPPTIVGGSTFKWKILETEIPFFHAANIIFKTNIIHRGQLCIHIGILIN